MLAATRALNSLQTKQHAPVRRTNFVRLVVGAFRVAEALMELIGDYHGIYSIYLQNLHALYSVRCPTRQELPLRLLGSHVRAWLEGTI